MSEERVTEMRTPSGDRTVIHSVVTDKTPRSRGGGATWVVLLIVLVVAVVAIYVFSQQSGAEIAKDNAIAGAADSVADAANQVGDAAQDAGDAARDTVDNR